MARDVRIDIVADSKKLKQETAEAERAIDKLKKGAQQGIGKAGPGGLLGDLVGEFAGGPATAVAAAGAAVGAFAVKAIGDFQKTALEADKLSGAMGVTVEEASRWMEVSGDLGVEVNSVAGAFNRMNRAASTGALRDLGIDADNASDRFVNVLKYLRGIPDETRRAAEAQKLLGRGWQEIAPLVNEVGELKDRLAGVSEQKVIDAGEVKTAREFRDSMDELRDRVDDVSLSVGGKLVPVLSDLATIVARIPDPQEWLPVKLPDWMTSGVPVLAGLAEAGAAVADHFADAGDEFHYTAEASKILSKEMEVPAERAALTARQMAFLSDEMEVFRHVSTDVNRVFKDQADSLDEVRRGYQYAREQADKYREVTEQARDAVKRLEEAERARAEGVLAGLDIERQVAQASRDVVDARQEWMDQNHEAVFAGELGLDPAKEARDAAEAFDAWQESLQRDIDAAGELARQWGADEGGVIQAMIDEAERLKDSNPLQADYLSRVIGLLQSTIRPDFTTGGVVAGGSTTTYNINTGADPASVSTATANYVRQNGVSGWR